MPGKHVRFHIPSTPQSNLPSISPPSFNQSGSPYHTIPLPRVETSINYKLSSREHLHWDLTLPADNAFISATHLERDVNDHATEPRLSSMRIICAALPQRSILVVESQRGYGVTIMDVLRTIYTFLRTPVSKEEYERLSPDIQWGVSNAYRRRYGSITDEKAHAMEKSKGLKLVDFLGKNKMFAGLRSTPQGPGVWELCLSSS